MMLSNIKQIPVHIKILYRQQLGVIHMAACKYLNIIEMPQIPAKRDLISKETTEGKGATVCGAL